MDLNRKNLFYAYQRSENFASKRKIVDEDPSGDVEYIDEEVVIYDYQIPFFQVPIKKPKFKCSSQIRKKIKRMESIKMLIAAENVDICQLGKSVIVGAADGSLNEVGLEKGAKSLQPSGGFLGEISIEALVAGMVDSDKIDVRYSMIGSSMMWNALKGDVKATKNNILEQTSKAYGEPKFDTIDLHSANLIRSPEQYIVEPTGVFSVADLQYIFSQLVFRESAKLLNKAKQFLKAYFIVACRPRCMIWRYTLRRSGASHKKAILNLPLNVTQSLLKILLDLSGIGDGSKPFHLIDQSIPFYQNLGSDAQTREDRYSEIVMLKDPLIEFFRDAITDCLNEIREMPFCIKTGLIVSPLRGRTLEASCVTWKQYEDLLKKEHDLPTETNMRARVQFEQKVCDVVPH